MKNEVEKLSSMNKEKDEEIVELQRKLVEGSGGEEFLKDLQEQLKNARESQEKLKEDYRNLEDMKGNLKSDLKENQDTNEENSKLQKDNDKLVSENKSKSDEIAELQRKLVDGTGGEEILNELQNKVKELEEANKDLKRKCEDLEDREKKLRATGKGGDEDTKKELSKMKNEVEKLSSKNKEKDEEIVELQRKLVDGTGGEEILKDLQEQLKNSRGGEEKLKEDCQDLEDVNETLKRDLKNYQDANEANSKLQKNNDMLVSDNQSRRDEIAELQRKLVDGTGGEEIFEELQNKLKGMEETNKDLRRRCEDFEDREKSIKENERGGDEGMEKKLNKMKKEVEKLSSKNKAKDEEIVELQRKLVEGTGGEEILKDLQEQLKNVGESQEKLEGDLEANNEKLKLDLKKIQDINSKIPHMEKDMKKLLTDNESKNDEIKDLQRRLVEGTGGEEILKGLQSKVKELEEANKDLKRKCEDLEDREKRLREIGKDGDEDTKKESSKMKNEVEKLSSMNKEKDEDIVELQRKLMEGTGEEEILKDLQEELKNVKENHEKLEENCRNLEDVNDNLKSDVKKYQDTNEENSKLQKDNDVLASENKSKSDEITKLQRKLVDGTGGEEILDELQNKVKELEEANKDLKRKCEDLEDREKRLREIGKDGDEDTEKEVSKMKNEVEKLSSMNKEKDEEIVELQRKLVEGTGGEEILKDLQEQLKDMKECHEKLEDDYQVLEDTNENLKRDLKTQHGMVKRFSRNRKESDELIGDEKPSRKERRKLVLDLDGDNFRKQGAKRGSRNQKQRFDSNKEDRGSFKKPDEVQENALRILEEKDYWKEKYQILSGKVGKEFVDIIPEVRSEELSLEKEKEEILSRLLKTREQSKKHATPAVQTMVQSKKTEEKLNELETEMDYVVEQAQLMEDLCNEDEEAGEDLARLGECLMTLKAVEGGGGYSRGESSGDQLNDATSEDRTNEMHDGGEIVERLCNETNNLQAEVKKREAESEQERNRLCDERLQIERELQTLAQVLGTLQKRSESSKNKNLHPGSVGQRKRNASYDLKSKREEKGSKHDAIQRELDEVRREVNGLQWSLEGSRGSSSYQVDNLVALLKEKSKLEDELSMAEKSLSQLGKRDYENLKKEREKQEKVSKRLLELSRKKADLSAELEEIDELVRSKERDLLGYFESQDERGKFKELPLEKEKDRPTETSGTLGVKSADEDSEGSGAARQENPQLEAQDAAVVSEELGALIQKKSSLVARLEAAGKETAEQSSKVEKTLLGLKEEPGDEANASPNSSSVDDLSQSQLSIFDHYSLVDELSLATVLVKEERAKRKLAKKDPMVKLVKEKAKLEKRRKELEGKVLVQNAKIKSGLRGRKDLGREQKLFAQAIEERKKVEDELATICSKIDECKQQYDEVPKKANLGKKRSSSSSLTGKKKSFSEEDLDKVGKPQSKNDKRRLLSRRESLAKQLEGVRRRIEEFSVGEGDDVFDDTPEMEEMRKEGNGVERLRELLMREVELKAKLEGKEDARPEGFAGVSETDVKKITDVLQSEKKNKEGKIAGLKKKIESRKESDDPAAPMNSLATARETLKRNIGNEVKALERRKMTLKNALVELSADETKGDLDRESLRDDFSEMRKRKELLETEIFELQELLTSQTSSLRGEPEQNLRAYEQFIELKKEEEKLEEALKITEDKISRRKKWREEDVEVEKQSEDGTVMASNVSSHPYNEILKKMEDEGLNMAEFIRELEGTRETLSKEREITTELVELIKSRVGNELMETLTGDGLVSPLKETAEWDNVELGVHQEVGNMLENDSITVEEVIADYQRVNAAVGSENKRLLGECHVLEMKIDSDLFRAIINGSTIDDGVGDSKKIELSKILENEATIYQQIVAARELLEEDRENISSLNVSLEILQEKFDSSEENLESAEERIKDVELELEKVREMSEGKDNEMKTLRETSEENELLAANKLKEKLSTVEKTESDLLEVVKLNDELKKELSDVNERIAAMQEKLAIVENRNKKIESALEEADKFNNELVGAMEDKQMIKEENEMMKEKIIGLEEENKIAVLRLEEAKEMNRAVGMEVKFEQLRKENGELKQKLDLLEEENNAIIPDLEGMKKMNKDLEDEVEYLHKEKENAKMLQEKLNNAELEEKKLREEFESLTKEKDELENFAGKDLGRNTQEGMRNVLDEYEKECKELRQENSTLEKECNIAKEVERMLGQRVVEKIIGLSRETEGVLEDTTCIPRCVENITKDKVTLGKLLENYEKDFDAIEEQLGAEVFDYVTKNEVALGDGKETKPLKVFERLESEDGKKLGELLREYENLISSQEDEIKRDFENVAKLEAELKEVKEQREKVEEELGMLRKEHDELREREMDLEKKLALATEQAEKAHQDADVSQVLMDEEYQELLSKVVEHQKEIEETEEMLRKQREQHEVEKEQLTDGFKDESERLKYQVDRERKAMEVEVHNLVNEIVRLKEERKDIRKTHRLEKEKMDEAFENERMKLYSNNEMVKNEMREELEKALAEVTKKDENATGEREKQLLEDLAKLREEKKEIMNDLKEVERKLEEQLSACNTSDDSQDSTENEKIREDIKNEFEKKLRQEKENFQNTLLSLRQEIERLQQERIKLLDEVTQRIQNSHNEGSSVHDPTHELNLYKKLESEFKEKFLWERASLESQVKELKEEKEELRKQKRDLRADLRNQRFTIEKKYEKEKGELSEKYHDELKALRNQLYEQERTEVGTGLTTISD